jgi:ABC-2 type transport system permease protein
MILAEIHKWSTTIVVSLSRYMAYKADFFLTLLAPSLVFILINYNVWASIYSFRGGEAIKGFSMEEMLRYQCAAFLVSLIIRSHRSWNLSEDIRLGRITSFLLYPFAAWKFHAAEFLAFQLIQVGTVSLAILVMHLGGFLSGISPGALALGLSFSVLVSALWFALEFFFGVMGFWLEETWVVRVIFQLFAVFLSGAFIPLELFPHTLRSFLAFTPFPLITSVPANIIIGNHDVNLGYSSILLAVWIALTALAGWVAWRRGMRLYTAAGM